MILDWNSEWRFRRSHVENGARRTTGQSGGAPLLPMGGQSPDVRGGDIQNRIQLINFSL
jgi:hypothetical protein